MRGFTVEAICQAVGMTRQAYYQGRRRRKERQRRQASALQLVRRKRVRQPRLGVRKLYRMCYGAFRALKLGRDALFGLCRRAGLLVAPRPRRHRTTDSRHGFSIHKNLLEGRKAPRRPNRVWAADITYVPTEEGFCYAALLTDCYSRKIVGYDLSSSLSVEGSLRALRRALEGAESTQGLIHHSDRGVQYSCGDYQERIEEAGMRCSMASKGNPYENALAERVNGTLKIEYGLEEPFKSEKEAREALEEAVELYNEHRPHLALDYRTPAEVHDKSPLKIAA